ncbi:uncharacterized protein LOC8038935, partial [Ixodes scapularis]|uniref:uncharacterized protein LOC8038935 n=1 Tax=Ixodes scapularis TaxID=6945 RepID=UPI001A9FBB5C
SPSYRSRVYTPCLVLKQCYSLGCRVTRFYIRAFVLTVCSSSVFQTLTTGTWRSGGDCAVDESGPFRHNFDSCVHCDWIWKSDACDAFYRELATANVESITYELASHPNPGLFSKFFGEKGYQRGKAVVAQLPTSKTDGSTKPPRGWSSETDWRRRISGVADVEKQSRKSTKLVMAQRAVSRLRHWTSGHQATDKTTTPARKDDEDDARSVEESTTLLDKDTSEDASTGSSVTKTSSSAGDLLKKVSPSSLKASRKARSTLSVVVNTAGNTRASGDFCSKAGVIRFNGGPGGSLKPAGKIMAGTGSDDTWPEKKVHQAECTQRSIDGFFKRFVRKK